MIPRCQRVGFARIRNLLPQKSTKGTERRSRNRIVVVLVLVIEPRHPIEDEDENEDDEEKFARRAKILRDSSTKELS